MANGIERIKNLMEKEKNKQILKVAEYLITREDMEEKYSNEEKNLNGMYEYIKSRAQKQAENGCAWVEDEEVYNWAIHYWDELEEDLAKEKTKDDKFIEGADKKPQKGTSKELTTQKVEQCEDDIVMRWKGKSVTRKQFNSKEYLSW